MSHVKIILLLVAGIAIRVFFIIQRQYPTGDEIWALFLSKASFGKIWLAAFSDLHPPLYFWFLKLLDLCLPFELSIFWLRIVSLFLGILSSFGVWYLASYVFSKEVGKVAFGISLFLPAFIWSSVYARYYSLLILFCILAIIFFLKFLKRGKWSYVGYLILVSILGVYTHYYFFLLNLALGFFLIAFRKYRALFGKWLMATVVICLALAPGLYYFLSLPKPEIVGRHSNHILKIPAIVVSYATSWETIVYLFYRGSLGHVMGLGFIGITVVLVLIYGLVNWQKWERKLFMSLLIVPPMIAILVAYLVKPLLAVGSLQIFLPVFLVISARAIVVDYKRSKILTLTFISAVFLSLIFFWQASSSFSTIRKDFEYIYGNFRKEDLILHAHISSFLYGKYLFGSEANFGVVEASSASLVTRGALGYRIIPLTEILRYERVWYIEPPVLKSAQEKALIEQLSKSFSQGHSEVFSEEITTANFENFNIYLWERKKI